MADAGQDPGDFPAPMGVRIDTGAPCRPLTEADAERIVTGHAPSAVALARNDAQTTLGADSTVRDANNLSQTGWAVLFASDADPKIKEQLQPLLDLRKQQVEKRKVPGMPPLFRVFEGPDLNTGGVCLGPDGTPQTALEWMRQHGASLVSPVRPGIVPYYVLIVGSPERIPFSFQQDLKGQWLVGRLYFDDIEDYGRYARHVVEQDSGADGSGQLPPQPAQTAVWITSNQGDVATRVLADAICGDFQATDGPPQLPLGAGCQFSVDFSVRTDATKARLKDILSGARGAASILFTGSHGAECSLPATDADAVHQRATQGALITQEWVPNQTGAADWVFHAEDIPEQNMLPGLMVFLFACFSAGCPAVDSYYTNPDGTPVAIAKTPMVSKLAQALLSHGALAVIGHVDRAFKYGFEDTSGTRQVQAFRTPLEKLMQGDRAGLAADSFSSTAGTLEGLFRTLGPQLAKPAALRMKIACDDARNYVVLGDPAVRLRVAAES